MIRPFTCVCLILAAGSGLYLYQVKQRAFALDASLRSTFHDIDAARDRTRMLRADWALVNDPERLQALASQYLKLQPMQPSQLLTMDQLAAALPPPVPASTTTAPAAFKPAPLAVPALSIPDPTHGVPMAAAIPPVLPHAHPATPEVALLQPAAPQPAAPQPAAPQPAAPRPAAPAAVAPPVSAASLPAPMAPPKPLHHGARHLVPQAQPWLANGNGFPPPPHRHADHHAGPEVAARQFYAANLPSREDVAARITPQAATVMYRPAASGSSLGMASSAALAPPRPLYPNSQ